MYVFWKGIVENMSQSEDDNRTEYIYQNCKFTREELYNLNSRLKIIHCSQSFDFSNFLQNSV